MLRKFQIVGIAGALIFSAVVLTDSLPSNPPPLPAPTIEPVEIVATNFDKPWSIAFDDEYTRHTLFRNFIDPYSWHWQNGNARWDILNVARFCYAHKEKGSLNWVINEKNRPIFKLDKLAPANNIEHANAHDAMADVRATIGIAKIIKDTQPKFFDYAFEHKLRIYLFPPKKKLLVLSQFHSK